VMEGYDMVPGDPTTGASKSATELAARIERRFLASRRCLAKDEFRNPFFGGHRWLPSACVQQK
jgi:hypothetical protein